MFHLVKKTIEIQILTTLSITTFSMNCFDVFCTELFCVSSPCENNGTCSEVDGDDYDCTCLPGYTDKNCETGKSYTIISNTGMSCRQLQCPTYWSKSKLGFYVPFNSRGHIERGPQHCHLWGSKPQR